MGVISNKEDKERLLRAQKKLKRLKVFYFHLAGYIVSVALLLYNLYIVEGPYKDNIISLNLSIIVAWTVLILLHAWRIFKEKKAFKESWEDKKMKQFLKEDDQETTMWE